ncbi:DUF3849 domain-containing protein [Bengtsoniella intestinalis]|uniref:DUF3849 domain-containing protein n=1 Tax=Bengtsoniella intestinalis TaxID=3073143 RepID=UPI00391F99B0
MTDNRPFYPHSLNEAKRNDDVETYYQSHRANVECKQAIENIIDKNYDGYRLKPDLAKQMIQQFGFDRTAYVLASSIQQKDFDGRISANNKSWAKEIFVPKDIVAGLDRRGEFLIGQHSGLLDIFANQYRKEYLALNLWDKEQVHLADGLDFEKKVLVLKPSVLNEQHKTRDEQLFYAVGGFGCMPNKTGRKVMGEFLLDGENAHFYREDFMGEAKAELLPAWAKEKLVQKEKPSETRASVLDKLQEKKADVTHTAKPPTKDKEVR